jgi:hypothetical protein
MNGEQFIQTWNEKAVSPVPVVSAADLHAMWDFYEDLEHRHPEENVAVGAGALQQVCPKADLFAVGYRCAMLQLIEMHQALREAWSKNGRLKDAVVEVLAKIPMEWMPVGVRHECLPFDVAAFIEQVLEAAARHGAPRVY